MRRRAPLDECGRGPPAPRGGRQPEKLRIDRIDLYQFHAPDPQVPFAESMGTLRLAARRKIRHLGVSNVTVRELEQARRIAAIVSVQNEYNIGNRKDNDVLVRARKPPSFSSRVSPRRWPRAALGQRQGHRRPPRCDPGAGRNRLAPRPLAVMLPIPGTRSIAHLEENAGAAAIRLTPDDIAALDKA